jgi:hypothetical protein
VGGCRHCCCHCRCHGPSCHGCCAIARAVLTLCYHFPHVLPTLPPPTTPSVPAAEAAAAAAPSLPLHHPLCPAAEAAAATARCPLPAARCPLPAARCPLPRCRRCRCQSCRCQCCHCPHCASWLLHHRTPPLLLFLPLFSQVCPKPLGGPQGDTRGFKSVLS